MRALDSGQPRDRIVLAAWGVGLIALAAIAGAWFFQLVLGLKPCPLCLEQRYAYYVGIPLALVIAVAASRGAPQGLLRAALVVLGLVVLANAGLGTYHAGVEWGWWQGPTECSGQITDFGNPGNLLESLKTVRVVRCDEVQWRFLGLSMAGYNVLISLLMAAIAVWGLGSSKRSR